MTEGRPRERILIVEDEGLVGLRERKLIAGAGYEVELVSGVGPAIEAARDGGFDLVLMDLAPGRGMDGTEAARIIRDNGGPPLLFLASHPEAGLLAKAGDCGAYGYVEGDSGDEVLLATLRMALEYSRKISGSSSPAVEDGFAKWSALDAPQKASVLRDAMADFDFSPIRELLDSFHGLTSIQVSLVAREGDFYASTPFSRACLQFHTLTEETREACLDANRRIEAFLALPTREDYTAYRCANGLRDIAQPLVIEGVHWATLFMGQFLYDEDLLDEAALALRAARLGWDVEDYLAALREVPRYSREKTEELLSFFKGLGRIVTSLALRAFKERLLSQRSIATEFALGESERRYRLLAQNVGDVIWTLDPATMRFTYVSPSIFALRGLSVEEALAEPIEDSLSPSSLAKVRERMGQVAADIARGDFRSAAAATDLYEQPCKGGGMKWVEITTKPVVDDQGVVVEVTGVSRDATARVVADEALKRALVDKDHLYAELQHRVKNSLALIVSLLSLSAGSISEEKARAPLEEAQVRVRTIGLLYEQLYRTHSVGDIDLGAYLAEVAKAVVESPLSQRGLRLELDCDSLRIETDRAVSAGLLLYELTANCVKHAFPRARVGRIRLSLHLEGAMVLLGLEDDGIGLGPDFDLHGEAGLGSLLISQLAVQLGGRAESGLGLGGVGAGFKLSFPLARQI